MLNSKTFVRWSTQHISFAEGAGLEPATGVTSERLYIDLLTFRIPSNEYIIPYSS